MSRIDELIEELCPKGVPFKPLGEIAELVRGNGMPKTDLTESGVGAIHYGQIYTRYNAWTNRTVSFVSPETAMKLAKAQPGDIIITNTSENLEDVGKAVAWIGEEPIVTGGHATVIKHNEDSKYLSYWFQSESFFIQKRALATGTKVIDVSAKQLAKVRIPVPPLKVQREIARILDRLSDLKADLEANLEAELEARQKQYEEYRTRLFDEAWQAADHLELQQLGRIVTGRTPKASDASAWGSHIDFVTPTDIKNGMKTVSTPRRRLSEAGAVTMSNALVPAGSLLVTCIGADMGKTVINANDCITNQQINAIIPAPDVDAGYLFHALTSLRNQLRVQGERGGGTMPIINKSDFSRIKLPVPPMSIQLALASKLDHFDALVKELTIGLPTELAARRKQYKHYRDSLMTFEEATA